MLVGTLSSCHKYKYVGDNQSDLKGIFGMLKQDLKHFAELEMIKKSSKVILLSLPVKINISSLALIRIISRSVIFTLGDTSLSA